MSRQSLLRIQQISRRCFCSQQQQQQNLRAPAGKIGSIPMKGTLPASSQLAIEAYMKSAAVKEAAEHIPITTKFNLFLQSIYKSYRESSVSSKLFYGSLLSLILFGDYLDRQYLEYVNPNGVYSFLADSPEDSIMQLCKTGDVVVFQRPLFSFNPLNILRTSFRQFACGGPYDHCGFIISNGHDGDFPYIVEIDQNYTNKLKITAFDERILTAREPAIFVRQIHKRNMSKTDLDKLSDWIDYKVNGPDDAHHKDYIDQVEEFMNTTPHKRDSMLSVLMTLCFNGDNTIKVRSAIRDLSRKIKQNEYEIATQLKKKQQTLPNQAGMYGVATSNKRHGRVRNVDDLIHETRRYKLQRVLKRDNLKKRESHVRPSMKINSSAFIGYFWRYIGILDEKDGAKPWEIRPQHFADSTVEVPLIGTTRLGHVQFVKTANETEKINDSERRFRSNAKNEWEQQEAKNRG